MEVIAKDCVEALFKFKSADPKFIDAPVFGVKPAGAIKWRRDVSLLEPMSMLQNFISRGYVKAPKN